MTEKVKFDLQETSGNRISTSLTLLFLLVMIGSTVLFVTLIAGSMFYGTGIEEPAGVWSALALDFKNGIFYRPLFSDSVGYGGTRYFPLSFTLQAGLLRLTGEPILSGHLVSLLAVILLVISCYRLLRYLGTGLVPALALALALLASTSVQFSLEGIRGDILPLALNLLGFNFYLSKLPKIRRELLAACCFTLAFSAKMTSVHGLVSLFLWLYLTGRQSDAFRMLWMTSTGYLLFLALIYVGSSGRIYEIFKVSSSAGSTIYTFGRAPFRFLNELRMYDSICLLWMFNSAVIIAFRSPKRAIALPEIFFGVSLFMTIFIFGSPGIQYNHFVDIAAASILLIGSTDFNRSSTHIREAVYLYLIIILVAMAFSFTDLKQIIIPKDGEKTVQRACRKKVVEMIKRDDNVVLSQSSLLPVLAGKAPYILDPYLVRLVLEHDATIRSKLFRRLENHDFSAIILLADPVVEKEVYTLAFGPDLIHEVLHNYKEEDRCGGYFVYSPRAT